MYDIKISNGTILDGTGAPGLRADIAVTGDRIAAIGDLKGEKAVKTIDASGKFVSPGFIDMHTHSDMSLLYDSYASSRIHTGVTTDVIGNCGIGVAPVNEKNKQLLLDYLATRIVGTIPAPLELHWSTFGEYLNYIDKNPPAVNVAPLLAQGAIRIAEMGFSKEAAAPDQIRAMRAEVKKAMEEGAIAMTSGLIYLPGAYTGREELAELCKELRPYGGYYCTHMRNEGDTIFEAIDESIYIAKTAGVPLHISHLKLFGESNFGQTDKIFAVLDKAEEEGLRVTFDCYPYEAGMSSLSALLPSWVFEGGVDKLVERIREPENRLRLRREIEEGIPGWQNPCKASGGFKNVIIASLMLEKNKWYEGKSVEEIAKLQGKDPYDVVFDTLIEENAKVQMVTYMMSGEDVLKIVTHPKTMFGSDSMSLSTEGLLAFGKPHPRAFGTFGRIYSHYVKELGVLTFEEAVKKMTSMPAALLRLRDRGILREGYFADVVVFDPDTIKDRATYTDPKQYTEGIECVIVNGKIALEEGIQTKTLAGRVLRNLK